VLVAGAYGHTRLREWMFGGITMDLLLPAQYSVLLSH
jgi:nucleotide-binding universal stress UspA family protein